MKKFLLVISTVAATLAAVRWVDRGQFKADMNDMANLAKRIVKKKNDDAIDEEA